MSQSVIRENLLMARTPLTPLQAPKVGLGLSSPLRPNSSPMGGSAGGVLHSINHSGNGVPSFASNSPNANNAAFSLDTPQL